MAGKVQLLIPVAALRPHLSFQSYRAINPIRSFRVSSAISLAYRLGRNRIGVHRYAGHPDLARRSVLCVHRHCFHGVERTSVLCTVDDPSDDGVLAVQMRLLSVRDEELGLVGVRTGIGACDDAATVKLEGRPDFICERLAPDRLAALASARRIAGLDHEGLDVTVPFDIIVRAGSAMAEEVFGRTRSHVAEHLDLQIDVIVEWNSRVSARLDGRMSCGEGTYLDVTEGGMKGDRHGCAQILDPSCRVYARNMPAASAEKSRPHCLSAAIRWQSGKMVDPWQPRRRTQPNFRLPCLFFWLLHFCASVDVCLFVSG